MLITYLYSGLMSLEHDRDIARNAHTPASNTLYT